MVAHPANEFAADKRPTLAIKEKSGETESGPFVARMHPDRMEYAVLFAEAPEMLRVLRSYVDNHWTEADVIAANELIARLQKAGVL